MITTCTALFTYAVPVSPQYVAVGVADCACCKASAVFRLLCGTYLTRPFPVSSYDHMLNPSLITDLLV